MSDVPPQINRRLTAMPFPLRNAGGVMTLDAEQIQKSQIFQGHCPEHKKSVQHPGAQVAPLKIGQMQAMCLKCTPYTITEDAPGLGTLALPFAGDRFRSINNRGIKIIESGEISLIPRNGGSIESGYHSSMIFEIDHRRLQRTISVIAGAYHCPLDLDKRYIFKTKRSSGRPRIHDHFWSYISFLDQLLGDSAYIATALGADEQIYRLLALSLLEQAGEMNKVQRRWEVTKNDWSSPLDELVDYIRQNAHQSLTLTDLEAQSHYSARHLQKLFKEKFDCTPMQYVRRQRLCAAMEKLQTADHNDTVKKIARDCGYSHTSNFTVDFKQEFGVNPSAVLRATRCAGRRK